MATTASTPARTTAKENANSSGPPVGLIVAPILLCVLIAALIFLWIKYKKRQRRRSLRRHLYSGDTESIPSATTPGANSTNPSETESHRKGETDKPLLSTSVGPSDEPVQSPESVSESVYTDEQSEKGQLDPIEERDDNPDTRARSARPVQAAAQRQRMVPQEEPPEPVEDQDPSESGGEEPEEEPEPETFRERRYDSGYRSYRQRPYYRDMYGRRQRHLLPAPVDSDESETEPKHVMPSRYPPAREGQGPYLNPNRQEFQGSTNSGISDQSETQLKMPVESAEPSRNRTGQESPNYTERKNLLEYDDPDSDDDDELPETLV